MPSIPEYTTGIVRRRAVADTVNFQAIEDAGSTMRGISKATAMGAEMAQKFKDADDLTALNSAVIAKQKSDMEWIDQQRKAREGNPNNFSKDLEPEIKKRDDEFMKGLSGAAKRQFKPTADRINLQTYESNLNWENTRKTQIFASRIQNSIDDNNLIMLRAGMEGRDPEEYLKNVDAATIAAGGVFSPEKLKDINGAGRSEGLKYYLEGMMENNPSKVKALLDSKKYDSDLDAGAILGLTNKAEAEIERLGAKHREEIREDVSDIEKAASLGLTVPDDIIQSLATRADNAGIDGMGDNLRKYASIQTTANDFAKLSIKDQQANIKTLETEIEGGDLSKVDEYSALANVLQTKSKMISTDPWGYYSAHDIVRAPEAINFQDPDAVKVAFETRRGDSARVKELEGFPLPLLTGQEVAQVKAIYDQDGGEAAANILSSIGQGLNFDERRSLSQQFENSDASIVAAALNQSPEVAEGILLGSKAKGEVQPAKAREAVNQKLSGMVFDPEANENIQSAVFAYYKKLSLDAGDASKEVDEKRMDRAIQEVVGKPAEISINGSPSKLFLYKEDGAFIKPNKLEDILGSFNEPVLRKANGSTPITSDGSPVDPEDIKNKATFTTYGDGQYIAIYPGLGYLMNENGGPYIFDIRKMEKAYQDIGVSPSVKRSGYKRYLK